MANAISEGDFRAAASFFKELNKIKGLDKVDVSEFHPEKFMPLRPVFVAALFDLGFDKIENLDLNAGMAKYGCMKLATMGSGKTGLTFTNEGSLQNDTSSKIIAKALTGLFEYV